MVFTERAGLDDGLVMSEAARDKLRAYGISPPERTLRGKRALFGLRQRRLSALRLD